MKKLVLAGLILTLGLGPFLSSAQTMRGLGQDSGTQKMLVGRVDSVDVSGTEITLTDGTKLLTPPGAMLRPGALQQGMVVLAVYEERENGDKILTALSLPEDERAPAKPGESPKRTE